MAAVVTGADELYTGRKEAATVAPETGATSPICTVYKLGWFSTALCSSLHRKQHNDKPIKKTTTVGIIDMERACMGNELERRSEWW